MTGIPGTPPDLRAVPSGCAFHPRCPHALERCPVDVPQLVPLSPGRYRTTGARVAGARGRDSVNGAGGREVACWLHDPATSVRVPEELSRPGPVAAAVPDPGDTDGGERS